MELYSWDEFSSESLHWLKQPLDEIAVNVCVENRILTSQNNFTPSHTFHSHTFVFGSILTVIV